MTARDPSDSPDPEALAARLDRVTYLLVGLVVLQAADLLGLGPAGLALFVIVGLFVTALYHADVGQSRRRR